MENNLIEKYNNEVQEVYDLYMKFFDDKIDIDVLYEKENIFDRKYNLDCYLIYNFIVKFSSYAKENYGIENLNKYVFGSKLYKKCYENYINYINGNISVGEYLKQLENIKIDMESYYFIVMNYAIYVLNMSKGDAEQLIKKGSHIKNTLEIIEDIVDENELFEILTDYGNYKYDQIENGNVKLKNLKRNVSEYILSKYLLDKDELEIKINTLKEKIQKVINKYNNMTREERKEQRENAKKDYIEKISKQSIELITKFISSNFTIADFLKEKEISRKDFDDALTSVSKYDEELFKKYNDHINEKKSERYAILISKSDEILNMIKNGIINEETNTKKEFDILDYYMYTNLPPEEFIKIARRVYGNNDLRLIRTFFANNKIKYNEERMIRETKFIINSVEITDEHKDIVINYLKKINAPISTKIFKIALKRYLKNELIIEEETNRKTR